jgi:hypothetical protein
MTYGPAIDKPVLDHEHVTINVDGLTYCVVRDQHGDKVCGFESYDSQWGAGMFTDWPRGHHKPYGA